MLINDIIQELEHFRDSHSLGEVEFSAVLLSPIGTVLLRGEQLTNKQFNDIVTLPSMVDVKKNECEPGGLAVQYIHTRRTLSPSEKRVKRIWITAEEFVGGFLQPHDENQWITGYQLSDDLQQLPDGCKVEAIGVGYNPSSVTIILSHPSWPEAEGNRKFMEWLMDATKRLGKDSV